MNNDHQSLFKAPQWKISLPVKQTDRLTRLSNSDWITLRKQTEQHELRIASLDRETD